MKNFVQEGKVIDVVAPSGGAVKGVPFSIGPAGEKLTVCPQASVAVGVSVACLVEGVIEVTKQAADAFVAGESVFWDDTNNRAEKSAAGLSVMGVCVETTAANAVLIKVKLKGQPSAVV